jgi:hypothetical protein
MRNDEKLTRRVSGTDSDTIRYVAGISLALATRRVVVGKK